VDSLGDGEYVVGGCGWMDRWDLTRAIFEKGLCLEPLPNFETKGECDGDEDDWLRSIRFLYIASGF